MDLLIRNYRTTTLTTLLFFTALLTKAQLFDLSNSTAWQRAGLTEELEVPINEVNILDFGADNFGATAVNTAYSAAISSLNGEAGTIYFPAGDYLFNAGISIPSNTVLKGASTETILKFNLGGTGDAIRITGTLHSEEYSLAQPALKGEYSIELAEASEFEVGDLVRLGLDDEDIMHSSWAYGTLGQVNEIISINGNVLQLADPLNRNYSTDRSPYVRRIEPIQNAGITCLKVVREDATTGQTDNIKFRNAFNCFVRNVESENCNFGHLTVQSSAHVQIENSYFHHAHAYGGGGQGYGVVFQEAASFNLAQNNTFEHLRHSMLLQSGANGNIFAYNYSIDPFWVSGFLPANSAGDAVLHGNHPYLNLFEGNVIQNIVVDASHGTNGPHNTFLRNRAQLYGFFSDAGTPTDSMNIIGNEITNANFPFGLFMVNGNGHKVYGNNVNGTVNPSGTDELDIKSLILDGSDDLGFLNMSELPLIGLPLNLESYLIPAETNYLNDIPVSCNSIVTEVSQHQDENPIAVHDDILISDNGILPATLQVFDLNGSIVKEKLISENRTQLQPVPAAGLYLIRVINRKEMYTLKVLLDR